MNASHTKAGEGPTLLAGTDAAYFTLASG